MIVYIIFQYLLIFIAFILVGYQLVLGICSLLPLREFRLKQGGFNHSFLFLIHLKDEEEQDVIKTLYSLYGLVYPSNLYDLLVITDSCSSNTVKVIRQFGVKVLQRHHGTNKWQPEIFHWVSRQLEYWEEKYDGIVLVEPGGLISGNFLEVMNDYLQNGSSVVQSSSFNILGNSFGRFKRNRNVLLIEEYIRSLGRKKMGLGTNLLGNGICFKMEIVKRYLKAFSQTIEDGDCSMMLMVKGVRIDFAPEALVWFPVHDTVKKLKSNKMDHKSSRFQRMKKYLKQFADRFAVHKSLQDFDTIIDLLTPSIAKQLWGTGGMIIINFLLWRGDTITAHLFLFWMIIFGMIIAFLVIEIVAEHAICLDFNRGSSKKNMEVGS